MSDPVFSTRVFIAFRHLVHSRPSFIVNWNNGMQVFIAFRHLVHSRRNETHDIT
ncbi:MAG: hypothetical protein M2R45_03552 [Verrucomicrobia subdivision 3 bacterium]|nr:hypothetical protein [Limisphaerales bacterium]MCS1416471.1 hypothetical protein [Limisphaerales bacterium]